ncbi:MAG: putative sulfate exporter family transporter [Actinobacteria bacterium]|nr:putative sulfate exporter family transporter [Actinomycetota bacterium]
MKDTPVRSAVSLTQLLIGIGVYLVIAVALAAVERRATWLPGPLLAIALGIVLGRVSPAPLADAAEFCSTHLLRAGIVLLGFKLSVDQLQAVGLDALVVIVPCVAIGAAAAYVAATAAGLKGPLRLLLAAGTAICGNSAIATVAPSLGASDDEITIAIATVTIYGTIALLAFPVLAHVLGLGDRASGMWAGTAINDTSQVVAASFSMSESAGATATIVKLARNLFIVPAAMVAPFFNRAGGSAAQEVRVGLRRLQIPWFVVVFVLAVAIASTVSLPEGVVTAASDLSKVSILAALVAIGIRSSNLRFDRRLFYPVAAGSAAGVVLAAVSLVLVSRVA